MKEIMATKQFSHMKSIAGPLCIILKIRVKTNCSHSDSFSTVRGACKEERNLVIQKFCQTFDKANSYLRFDESKVMDYKQSKKTKKVIYRNVCYEMLFRVSPTKENLVDEFIQSIEAINKAS